MQFLLISCGLLLLSSASAKAADINDCESPFIYTYMWIRHNFIKYNFRTSKITLKTNY